MKPRDCAHHPGPATLCGTGASPTVALPAPYVNASYLENDPRFSPDGRWVAWVGYGAFETDNSEVFGSTFPTVTDRVQISAGGGSEPLW